MDQTSNSRNVTLNPKGMKAFWAFGILLTVCLMIFLPQMNFAQSKTKLGRTCATMDVHEELLRTDRDYYWNQQELENFTEEFRLWGPYFRTGEIIIPVVVHVVYRTAAENISDAQIHSQIDVLNEDYRMLNPDISLVPPAFQPDTADTRIRFQLAVRDPDCQPTTGITRTLTTQTSFAYSGQPVKYDATGGKDAWPRDRYLNIWVCNLTGGLLGYAQFPGGLAATDGVVILYRSFGRVGPNLLSPYDEGRTATHEVGHWLNLRHIWGDDYGACTGTDFCADTPNQDDSNGGCPTYPHASTCHNDPHGDMFMNYMDYVNDACMYMFTQDQSLRMSAALFGTRYALLGSDALLPPMPPADLFSQDTPEDTGAEPNNISTCLYHSDDIWVRNQADGFTYHEHQDPIYCDPSDPTCQPNYVYVRVRNRGCTSHAGGNVKLYWAKASGALAWPTPWDGTVSPPLMGGLIGVQPTGAVATGDHVVLQYQWYPENPNNYPGLPYQQKHFCLLSRIETSTTAPYGMTYPEGGTLWLNVKNNNNIVWKNIAVIVSSGGGGGGSIYVGNITQKDHAIQAQLTFNEMVQDGEPGLFEWGTVDVQLGDIVFNKWKEGGLLGRGIKILEGNTIRITGPGASIENLRFEAGEVFPITVQFMPFDTDPPTQNKLFKLNVAQEVHNGKEYEPHGGEVFVIKSLKKEGVEK